MPKAFALLLIGFLVFGFFLALFWMITAPVFKIVPAASGLLLVFVIGFSVLSTVGVMRLVYELLNSKKR